MKTMYRTGNRRVTEEQYEIVNVAENGRYDFQLYAVSFNGKNRDYQYRLSGVGHNDTAGCPNVINGRWRLS